MRSSLFSAILVLSNQCAPLDDSRNLLLPFRLFRCFFEEDFRRLILRPIYLHIPRSVQCLTYCAVVQGATVCAPSTSWHLLNASGPNTCVLLCSEYDNLPTSLADAADER